MSSRLPQKPNHTPLKHPPTLAESPVEPSRTAFVQSLERGLAVIKSFGAEAPKQSVADVAAATGLDRFSARRLLLTLETMGYVKRDGGLFRLSAQTLQLGYAYLSSLPWWHSAQSVSEQLTAKVGVSSAVGVLDKHDVVYVAYASAQRFPLLWNRSVGVHLPAATTAIGRVLIAALPPRDAKSWLATVQIKPMTSRTRTSPAAIGKILQDVEKRGYAVVDQELEIGLRSLGVPVKNKAGETIAGLSVSVVDRKLNENALVKRYLKPLQEASREISMNLPT
jgi:IclR family pca regulon transcriptional regulator